MKADETLRQIRGALAANADVGLDPEGVRLLLRRIDRTVRRDVPTTDGRTITRAECVEPSCPHVDSVNCPFPKDHEWQLRTYVLSENVDAGE